MDISIEEFWIKVVLSIICGCVIGVERQIKGKPSGIRTSIFICLGTAAFISLGQENINEQSDMTRVLGQVVTGIGFLGAGVIIAREGLIIGITSASVIWVLAGIGSMIGFGNHVEAVLLSLVSLFILLFVGFIENRIPALSGGIYSQNYHHLSRADRKTDHAGATAQGNSDGRYTERGNGGSDQSLHGLQTGGEQTYSR